MVDADKIERLVFDRIMLGLPNWGHQGLGDSYRGQS